MAYPFLAPTMFAALVLLLLLGYPVAFSLAANGMFFALLGIHFGLLQPELLQALPERIFGIMRNETLLAIPFFTFMGLVLERSGMAEDLLDTIGQLFGRIRGGLAYAVVLVGTSSGGNNRRSRRNRDRDGPHFAPDHDALRLFASVCERRYRSVGDARQIVPRVSY